MSVLGAIKTLKSCEKQGSQVFHGNNKQLAEVRDALARCYAMNGKHSDLYSL